MRFLLVTPHTVPDFSGSGINAFNFARFLVKKGINANLLSMNRDLGLKAREEADRVPIRRLPYFNGNYLLKLLSLFIILPGYFIYALRNDVILIYGGKLIAWEIMVLFCRMLGKKVIFQSLLTGVDDVDTLISGEPVLLKRFYRRIFGKIHIYHALNTELKTHYLNNVPKAEKILLNPQGVDTDIFFPIAAEEKSKLKKSLGFSQEKLLIITIGSLIPRKGFEELFLAVAGLDIPYHLLVVGEYQFPGDHFLKYHNEYALNIYNKAKELLNGNVTFTGGVRNIDQYIKASDIAVFNSVQEGLSNALLEVMACGVPPVIRDYPGIAGYFIGDRKNALIFNEPGGMVETIRSLFNDQGMRERIGSAARATVEKDASFEVVLNLYRDKLNCQ